MLTVTARTEATSRELNRIAGRLADRRVVNRQLSIDLHKLVLRNFQQEGHEGKPWEPLKPSTVRARERRQKKPIDLFKILQDTGYMRQSFDFFSDNDQAGVGAVESKAHAELSVIHELGLGHVPARPMLPSRERALKAAMDVYGHFVARAVRP